MHVLLLLLGGELAAGLRVLFFFGFFGFLSFLATAVGTSAAAAVSVVSGSGTDIGKTSSVPLPSTFALIFS